MPELSKDFLVILTTVGSEEEAQKIARSLIEHKLAACVNILGKVNSIYRWKGKIEQETEHLLLIKSTRGRFARVSEAIHAVHSYDIPEVIALPVQAGSSDYLNWLAESLAGG